MDISFIRRIWSIIRCPYIRRDDRATPFCVIIIMFSHFIQFSESQHAPEYAIHAEIGAAVRGYDCNHIRNIPAMERHAKYIRAG